jgi:uncharacterized membrane protein
MSGDNPISTSDMEDGIEIPVFEAVIRPYRSLGGMGLLIVLGAVGLVSLIASIPFMLLGAWPVAGFFGLDLLGLYIALRINNARARAVEHVIVTRVELLVRRIDPRGRMAEWRANPRWTRLERDIHPEFGVMRLVLVSRGERRDVGATLSTHERADFGNALAAALVRAR